MLSRLAIILALLSVLVLSGCGSGTHSSRLVGSWKSTAKHAPPTWTFNADGTMSQDFDLPQFGTLHVHTVGTWHEESGMLAFVLTEATPTGLSPSMTQGPSTFMSNFKSGMHLNEELKLPIQWTSDDSFDLEGAEKHAASYKRIGSAKP